MLGRVGPWKIGHHALQVAVCLLSFLSKLSQLHLLRIIHNHLGGNTFSCEKETKGLMGIALA